MAKLSDILQQFKAEINQLIQEKEYSKISDKIDQLHKQIIYKKDSRKKDNSEHLTNIFEQELIENEKYL